MILQTYVEVVKKGGENHPYFGKVEALSISQTIALNSHNGL